MKLGKPDIFAWLRQKPLGQRLLRRLPRVNLSPRASLGIALGTREIFAVRLVSTRKQWLLDWSRREKLAVPLFQGAPGAETTAALTAALTDMCGAAARAFIPVHVVLPDPMTAVSVFELEALPASRAAQQALVQWRFAREVYGDDRPLICASQALGQHNGKQLLFGMALDMPWFECLRQAFRDAGIVPWSLSPATCCRFNRFHPLLTAEARSGALVSLDPDAWTLSLWDSAGRLRWLRGRWRDGASANTVYDDIALETERFILSYVHSGDDRHIDHVYVAGGDETPALTAALDHRLRERSIPLTTEDGTPTLIGMKKQTHSLLESALAAATGV